MKFGQLRIFLVRRASRKYNSVRDNNVSGEFLGYSEHCIRIENGGPLY